MNIVVIEDERLASDRLINLLLDYDPSITIQAQLDSVESAVAYFKTKPAPDLIFLDIALGDGKSFEIFSHVEVKSHIIFATAYNEYAIQAFKYNSIDYLLKPIKKEELWFAMDKFKDQVSTNRPMMDMSQLMQQLTTQKKEHKSRFLVKKGSRFYSVETKDVSHIYTKDRVHFIKTFNGTDYIIDSNLDELETELDPSEFYRANRQFIINFKAITEVVAWFDGKLKVALKPAAYEDLIISRLKANEFKKWLSK